MTTIIAILSQKGGGGKSTLARTLAVELTKQNQKTLLVDLDIQQKTSQEWSERRKRKNIKPLISCQSLPYFEEKLIKTNYDYLIIDCPARISKESLIIAKHASLIIQPVRPSLDDLNPAIREFHALVRAGISKKKLALVINCVNSNAEEKNTREYLTEAGYFVFSIALLDKVSYREAQNQGLSISEVKYPRLSNQVQLLVKSILSKI
ncbi:ParA family protein [endosymbiont GvMRE of Glomus versiforme]|uniref:ParA family protein n=1 Tax=endosymbiont GvMRE of Glomus versiforme TaxID=2039283 RepID=UPI000EE3C075|nr:ParA family protein [endosymbiont GvMRE of Glomus versiforme]RHZ35929.1 ParA-like plasmid partition protein [endosymbiont GvMRE of Glomus versiforme]